jgi:hypothetical protein
MISRISYSPWWPLTDRCAAFHAVITGSISAHRSSVKSLGYRLRSLIWPSKHSQARRPAITTSIHTITLRQVSHTPAKRPLNDAFVAMCTHWSDIRDGSPRGYLYTVARNEISRRRRVGGRRPEVSMDSHAATTRDFAQQVVDHQTLRGALDSITGREREAVLLLHDAGFDLAGAAQVMGCMPGSVKRYAFDGRMKLRRVIAGSTGSGTRREETR